ncbi:MAG: molybdopterin-dependent oxidoreductase [Acidimicrobiia bacterium]
MPKVTRRTFVKTSAIAAGGTALARNYLFGPLDTVSGETALALQPVVEDVVPTTCWIGKQDCGMLAHRVDGRVIKFEGNPANPRNAGTLCPKGQAQIVALYDPNRVKWPLVRTNAKGGPGEWRRATWDEALQLVADQVNEVRERDPKAVLWQKGRSKAKKFYDDAFVKALGAAKMGHGAYCSDSGYRALEYTIGTHAVLHPDFRHCNYLLSWGWNITGAGGNKTCWLQWPRHMVEARERGLKIDHIDPRLRSAGPFADSWLPIKPGTDLALALALCHELIAQGHLDLPYLATYTNSPYLVKPDGMFARVTVGEGEDAEDLPLVWDEAAGAAVPHAEAASPALEGSFVIDGETVRPAFELFKDHVAQHSPEWAAGITGLPATEIRRIATEFGEKARIGSTLVVDGVEVPYRPVGIMAYHVSQQELGFQAMRAMTMVPMLVGAMGAAGGQLSDYSWKIHKNYPKFEKLTVDDPPYDYFLNKSKYFPINTGLPGLVAKVMQDPAKYGVEKLPEVAILHMVNPLSSFASQSDFMATYGMFKFVAVISPWLSETADYFADVVLPSATIEKYEGPVSTNNQYMDGTTLRIPPMEPLFESKGEIDIYMDLTEKMGLLYGEDGYLYQVNKALGLVDDKAQYGVDINTKPQVRGIFDNWARSEGIEQGVEFFEDPAHSVYIKGPVKPTKMYGYVSDPPFGGAIHRLYGESLLDAQNQMKAKGAEEIYYQDYTALPTWRTPTMDTSPADYDMYMISYKLIEHKQARTSFVPLLAELAPGARADLNPETANRLGVENGDAVTIESHNAVTGETRTVVLPAALCEGIRPDTVGIPHHFGMWTHPVNEGQGSSPNELYFTGEGYTTNTADQSFHVKVRVTKGGEV